MAQGHERMSEKQLARPLQPVTNSIARISLSDEGRPRVYFPEKLEAFRDVVKRLRYEWQGMYWVKTQDVPPERLEDCLAELARDLLANGFLVKADTAVIDAAVSGNFVEEPRRTIAAEGELYRIWWGFYEECGDVAHALPGARWKQDTWRVVLVPAEQYEAVLDFAAQFGFVVMPSALDLMEEARAELEGAVLVQVTKGQALPTPVWSRKPQPLEEPDTAVLASLLDD
jgi:hypothetical protein